MLRHTLLKALPFRSFFAKPMPVSRNVSLPQVPYQPVRTFWASILKLAATAGKDVGLNPESFMKINTMRSLLDKQMKIEHITIEDVSGGCGAFFKIMVVSDAFTGKSMIARHRLVQGILKEEIKDMHGITLNTFTPEQYAAQSNTDPKK